MFTLEAKMNQDESVRVFSKRLKNARLLKGLSALQVAESLHITRQAYSKYENGKSFPNSKILIDLHRILDVSIDYLFRKTSFEKLDFDFRKKTKLTKTRQEQIELEVFDLLEKRIEIEDLLNVKVVSDLEQLSAHLEPIKSSQEISLLASALRTQWGLGNDPIKNVSTLFENHGIITVRVADDNGFDGASSKIKEYGNRPVVIVNNNTITERQRFTAVHELAHLYLKFTDLESREIESLCNTFANEFLLPSPKLNEIFVPNGPIYVKEIQALQAEYGLSFDAIVYRLNSSKIISDSSLKRYFIRKNTNPNLKDISEKSLFSENGSFKYESLVFKALNEDVITSSQAAQYLNVSIEELGELGAVY